MKKVFVLLIIAALLLSAGCVPLVVPATEGAASTVPTALPETTTLAPETAPVTTEAPAPTEPAATEAPVTEAPSTEAPVPTTEAPAPVDPWSLLGSGGYEAGSYTDELGNEYDYSWDLPLLLADTESARAINADIDANFGEMIRYEKENMEEGLSMGIIEIGFRGIVWEDVLTVEIVSRSYFDGWEGYGIYSYETSTGRWLTTADVLERMGYTQDQFLDTCRIQFRQYYVDMYSQIPESDRSQYGYYQGLDRQITSEFVNMDLLAYPEDGDIVVIAPIVSLAGADYYYHVIHLGMGGSG